MFKKKTIRIEFYDVETGKTVGYDEQRLKKLPEDFELKTLVEINGTQYEVLNAEPDARKKIKRSGTLLIKMKTVREETKAAEAFEAPQEMENVPVALKTFLSPSKPDIFPAFTGQRAGLNLLEMGTWEWRAVEFVDALHVLDIKTEFASIRDLKAFHSRMDSGREVYDQQHRRSLISKPLGNLKMDVEGMIQAHFEGAKAVDGITFMGADGIADGGFAFHLNGGTAIYGLAIGEQITHLGMVTRLTTNEADLAKVAGFLAAHSLVLVDWRALELVEGRLDLLKTWHGAAKAVPEPVVESGEEMVEEGLDLAVAAEVVSEALGETEAEAASGGEEVVAEDAGSALGLSGESADSGDEVAESAEHAVETAETEIDSSAEKAEEGEEAEIAADPGLELKLVDLDSLGDEEE